MSLQERRGAYAPYQTHRRIISLPPNLPRHSPFKVRKNKLQSSSPPTSLTNVVYAQRFSANVFFCQYTKNVFPPYEALVRRLGVGVRGATFWVFPLFAGVHGVLLTGFRLSSTADSPMAAERDRFGEGGGRLRAATDQYLSGLFGDLTHKTSTRFGLAPDPF